MTDMKKIEMALQGGGAHGAYTRSTSRCRFQQVEKGLATRN